MERIPYGIYSKELREEAVKLVTEGGLSMTEVGRRLEIPPQTLRNWVKAHKKGTLSEIGKARGFQPLASISSWLRSRDEVLRRTRRITMAKPYGNLRDKMKPERCRALHDTWRR